MNIHKPALRGTKVSAPEGLLKVYLLLCLGVGGDFATAAATALPVQDLQSTVY